MSNLDELFDIYQGFLAQVILGPEDWDERVKMDETNTERARITMGNGFTVELTNKANVENGATLHCWYENEEHVEISSFEQLMASFCRN